MSRAGNRMVAKPSPINQNIKEAFPQPKNRETKPAPFPTAKQKRG